MSTEIVASLKHNAISFCELRDHLSSEDSVLFYFVLLTCVQLFKRYRQLWINRFRWAMCRFVVKWPSNYRAKCSGNFLLFLSFTVNGHTSFVQTETSRGAKLLIRLFQNVQLTGKKLIWSKREPTRFLKFPFDHHERGERASFTRGVSCVVPTGSLWAAWVNSA